MAALVDFRSAFPEFGSNVSDGLITLKLSAAALELDMSVWGPYGTTGNLTRADQGQLYLTAHKLATSPFGQNAKMVLNPRAKGYDKTAYGSEFKRMMQAATSGYRVA